MSLFGLRGRAFFDALQHHPYFPSHRFRLPCPPYNNPTFWDQLYKDMTYDMVNEWGAVDLTGGLLTFRYQCVPLTVVKGGANSDGGGGGGGEDQVMTRTFADWMDVTQLDTPEEATQVYQQQQQHEHSTKNEAILILGCGNSKLGEQLLTHSFIGPILQLDISTKVIQLMTQRYHNYLSSPDNEVVKRMEFMVDDASTGLTSLEPQSVGGGVVDKGLLDVLHCSAGPMMIRDDGNDNTTNSEEDEDDMIQRIMSSVHNVLQPSRPFVFFSRSEPQWMLRRVLGNDVYNDLINGGSGSQQGRRSKVSWRDVEVVKLVDYDLMLYKLVKADEIEDVGEEEDDETTNSIDRRSYLKRLKSGAKKSKR